MSTLRSHHNSSSSMQNDAEDLSISVYSVDLEEAKASITLAGVTGRKSKALDETFQKSDAPRQARIFCLLCISDRTSCLVAITA